MQGIHNKYVSYTKFDSFFEWYILNLDHMHMIERTRYPCKLFIDIDKVIDIHQSILKVSSEFPLDSFIVCVNEMQNGIHIIFQNNIIHDYDDAIDILNNYGYDLSVYKTGLRMIGSKKKSESKRYYPYCLVDKQCIKQISNEITIENLKLCSILIPFVSVNWPSKKLSRQLRSLNTELFVIDCSNIDPKYNHVSIQSIGVFNRTYILKTNMKYCSNIKREHKSNTIYFVVRNKRSNITISQKCFCRCSDKTCSTFETEPIKIPIMLYNKIVEYSNTV